MGFKLFVACALMAGCAWSAVRAEDPKPAAAAATQAQQDGPKRANKGPVGEDWVPLPERRANPFERRMPASKPPPGISYARKLPFYVPRGTKNIARGKPVSASATPVVGSLAQLTDGDAHATDGSVVVLPDGLQWAQIDLEANMRLRAVRVWHNFWDYRHFRQVVVQVSDDPAFKQGTRTLFNNATERTESFEAGRDPMYIEMPEGMTIDGEETVARYVRLYLRGSNQDGENHYIEVQAWGEPVEPEKAMPEKK